MSPLKCRREIFRLTLGSMLLEKCHLFKIMSGGL